MKNETSETKRLNKLLKGELSAVETYEQVLQKVGDEPEAMELRRIESEHRQAIDSLREHVVSHGGEPVSSGGGWEAWAKTVTGAAKILGDKSALKALKEGEEHGAKDYDSALQETDLPEDCRSLIQTLLPRQQEHIQQIDRMISRM